MASSPRRISRDKYKVACICSIGCELAAVEGMLDEIHEVLRLGHDQNSYTLGRMGVHNIVVAAMPETGSNRAATVATQLLNDFPSIRLGLSIGVGGGIPGDEGEDDIRLGDVVVSEPTSISGGMIQYDGGKVTEDGILHQIGFLRKPPAVLSASIYRLQSQQVRFGSHVPILLSEMLQKYPKMKAKYAHQGANQDNLFEATYAHHGGGNCNHCDQTKLVSRDQRADEDPHIHYGTIGSGNMVIKDAATRDQLRKTLGVLCVEMEAAGLPDGFPCAVIRGICDYADSHKNQRWQPYAAATAAAYAKELLHVMPSADVLEDPEIGYSTGLNQDDLTDEGYSSALSTTSMDVHFIAEEIALFLLDNDMLHSLMDKAFLLETQTDAIVQQLRPLIRRYGRTLNDLANEAMHHNIAQELMRHAPYIATALVSLYQLEAAGDDVLPHSSLERQKRIESLMQTRRKEGFSQPDLGNHELGVMPPTTDDTGQDELLQISKPALEDARSFMATKEALNSFLANMSRMVYSDHLVAIKEEVQRGLELTPGSMTEFGVYAVSFEVMWSISEYVKEEFGVRQGHQPDLRSLLVLNGEPDRCYATTCENYMRQLWPKTCDDVLHAMKVTEAEDKGQTCSLHTSMLLHPESGVTIGVKIYARASLDVIIEIAQQLSWLSAAIRVPRQGEVCLSEVFLQSTHGLKYVISPLPLQTIKDGPGRCWLSFFRGTVLARGYPTPVRGNEKGVELPFHLLLSLAGPLYPSTSQGGIYLRGFSRIFVPTKIYSEKDDVVPNKAESIQWHLETSGHRRSRFDSVAFLETYRWEKIENPDRLAAARTFLGFSAHVNVNLGTEKDLRYYKDIGYSGAEDELHGPSIQAPSSVAAGTPGMGVFGFNVSTTITWGKALAQNLNEDNESFLDVLDLSAERPMILYDNSNASAFMVQTLCVLLHMIHTWAANMNDCTNDIPFVEPTWDAARSARKKLEDKSDCVLRKNADPVSQKQKMIKDLVMQFWDTLTQRSWEVISNKCKAQTPKFELATKKLYGWEYLDIVRNKQTKRKQVRFGGNWNELANEVVVLFGKNFGDVITSAPDVQVCSAWNPIPSQQQYLIATIDCLRVLAWERGGNRTILNSPRLTNTSYWYQTPANLFSDCEDCLQDGGSKCIKLPQSLNSAGKGSTLCLVPPSQGAVAFGYNKLQKKRKSEKSSTSSVPAPQAAVSTTSPVQGHGRLQKAMLKAARIFEDHTLLTDVATRHSQPLADQTLNHSE